MSALDKLLGREPETTEAVPGVLDQVREQLFAIDPSFTIARREELKNQIAELDAAIVDTERRNGELRVEIATITADGMDPLKASEAVLTGSKPQRLVPELEAEREHLIVAVKGLRLRAAAAREDLVRVTRPIASEIAAAFDHLIDEFEAEAMENVARLAAIYATLAALGNAATSTRAEAFRAALRDVVGQSASNGLIAGRQLQTPDDVVALNDVPAMGQLKYAIPDAVSMPDAPVHLNAAIMSMVSRTHQDPERDHGSLRGMTAARSSTGNERAWGRWSAD